MLPVSLDTIRLFIHVLAAAVWVGGQLVLAGLVPVLREAGQDTVTAGAQRFAQIAWPAFGLTVVTGIWNILEVDFDGVSSSYHASLGLKLVLVTLAGLAVAAHSLSDRKAIIAAGGAIGLIASLGALFVGLQLSGA